MRPTTMPALWVAARPDEADEVFDSPDLDATIPLAPTDPRGLGAAIRPPLPMRSGGACASWTGPSVSSCLTVSQNADASASIAV